MKALHIRQVLVNSIRRTGIPFAFAGLFIRRKQCNTTDVLVKVPGNPDPDMRVQAQRLVLGQDTYGINPGIDAVAERKIDDPVLPAKRHGRLGHFFCQHTQPAPLTACQEHGDHIFFYHCCHSLSHRFLCKIPM